MLAARPALKVVLMSATADADLFDAYRSPGPTRTSPGFPRRRFTSRGPGPVREYFLEDVFEMTGHAVGRGGPYAKRKEDQAKRVKRVDAAAEAMLAEKAKQRRRERMALGLEDAEEDEDEDDNDEGDEVPEDWDLVDENAPTRCDSPRRRGRN